MRTSQVSAAAATCIKANLPLLLVGAPGVGKSDLVAQAAEAQGAEIIISHPAVGDPTDVKGLPWLNKSKKDAKEATFLPFGDLARALNAKKKTVWFLDDLGQATPAVQAAYMQLLLARRVNEHVLPDCVTFVAATNGRSHRAGVNGILEPVKSRFATIIEVEAHIDDWTLWAYDHGIPVELVHFLRWRSELLHKFEPTTEMKNSPSPRTWHNVAKLYNAGVPEEIQEQVFAGAVGDAAAREWMGYLALFRECPNLDAIILDPDCAPIPDKISILYATVSGLVRKATPDNFGRIVRYAERLLDAGKGEFGVMLTRDCARQEPKIVNSAAYTKMTLGPIGQLYAA